MRTFLVLVVIALQCPSVFCQTAANLQVGHDSWTFKEGAPTNILALAQTTDGFLWLGTAGGLFRFDGLRFEPFNSPFGDRLLSNNGRSLLAPASGGLWIGYLFGGFSFLNNGRLTNYISDSASPTGSINDLAQDRDGIVWAATPKVRNRDDTCGSRPGDFQKIERHSIERIKTLLGLDAAPDQHL